MAAAANAYQAGSAISGLAGGPGSGSLLSAEVGVGFASSNADAQSSGSWSMGSSLSGTNVTLTSTQGDIHVTQGNLTASDALTLDAKQNLILEAGQNQNSSQERGSNAGLEVGVGVSVGAQTGIYVYGQALLGR